MLLHDYPTSGTSRLEVLDVTVCLNYTNNVGSIISKNEAILLLNNHPKIGAQTIKKISKALGRNFYAAICDGGEKYLRQKLDQKYCDLIAETRQYSIDKIKDEMAEHGIGYVTFLDAEYPKQLLEISDCPAVIYIKGDYKAFDSLSLALVGSRKYSSYGARVARKIAGELAGSGITIVSGLALGIDAAAHRATLDNHGRTVGVLGCGIDTIYPLSNSGLAKDIVESGGAIISEYPLGTKPFKSNFPARNRIIAGLTLGTVVVEAAMESGALITALAALEYNREVFAVPGPIDAESSQGCNHLIQQGAKLVTTTNDILNELNIELKKSEHQAKKIIAETAEQQKIINLIDENGSTADDLVRGSALNVAVVSQTLTILEMKGILENVGGLWRKKI